MCLTVILCLGFSSAAEGAVKIGLHGVYMEPYGKDASDYAGGAVGWGVQVTTPAPRPAHFLALILGFDNTFLQAHTTEIYATLDPPGVIVPLDMRTRQRYTRLYAGAELGGHGSGFLRPHVGINLAAINYGYSVDYIFPDDNPYDDVDPAQWNQTDVDYWVFGQDISAGLDLRFTRNFSIDGGVRYMKSYSLPQELPDGSITVDPEYVQFYLAIGFSFDARDFRK